MERDGDGREPEAGSRSKRKKRDGRRKKEREKKIVARLRFFRAKKKGGELGKPTDLSHCQTTSNVEDRSRQRVDKAEIEFRAIILMER